MKIGIRAEDKSKWERRVPLVPEDIINLAGRGLLFTVQSSGQRVFSDDEFSSTGIQVQNDLKDCKLIFGLKEIPIEKLEPEKIYCIFSHVIKGQAYNMAMFERMMDLKITLIDYERIIDKNQRRLLFFGRHAGIAGMVNTLWAFGRRLALENISNPFEAMDQAKNYPDMAQLRNALASLAETIKTKGIPEEIHPLVVGIAGYGNVARGAMEILNQLPVKMIPPEDVFWIHSSPDTSRHFIYVAVFKESHLVDPIAPNHCFDLSDYYQHGKEKYKSLFDAYIKHLNILVNAIYWDDRYPRLVTLEACRQLWSEQEPPRLKVIGDISCDVKGAIECTVKATYPDHPVYVYEPGTGKVINGVSGNGPVIMAVEILPSEIPREASMDFSRVLRPFVPILAAANFDTPFEKLKVMAEIKNAIILYKGELTPDYRYLEKYL